LNVSGIEDLKAAFRRSGWLIVALVIMGVVAMNVIKQLEGPKYQASSSVLLPTSDLTASLTGVSPPYVDPQRQDNAEQNLANSPQLYQQVAAANKGALGSGGEISAATSVSVSNNVVTFTASTSDPHRAVSIVNAVAALYPKWRAGVFGRVLSGAIKQVQDRIKAVGRSPDLVQQLQRLQVVNTLNSSEAMLVEQASGAAKTTPHPKKDSLVGGAIGLVIALLVVGVRELFDTTVRSEADVEDSLGVPVIGTIQSLPRRLRSAVLGSNSARWGDEYELLAANVAQLLEERAKPVNVAITSAVASEGKTTTAVNLAAALARRGASVVLVDFDLRKPALSEFFSIPPGAGGIYEVLEGSKSVEAVAWSYPLNGSRTGSTRLREKVGAPARSGRVDEGSLMVLPGGRVSAKKTHPSFSRLPQLLTRLDTRADFVVIDTPPALLAAGVAELVRTVDAVIVVVRQGQVTRRRLRALARQANTWRGKFVGAVLNDAPPEEDYRYYAGA
jgi:succinoglycan biosynthesis transport protein ExoP